MPTSNLWNLDLTQDKANNLNKVRIWSFDDTGSLDDCDAIACSRDSDSANAEEREDLEENGGSVIRLSASELCKGTGDDCHVFVEHINLISTRLLIETSANRPVVLHLEYPSTSTVSPSEPGITGSINLGSGAQLCGVDAWQRGLQSQAGTADHLVCCTKTQWCAQLRGSPETDQYVLAFDGDSLPAASVHLIPGIVKTGNSSTSLNGRRICNGSGWHLHRSSGTFDLIREEVSSGDSTVVRDLNDSGIGKARTFRAMARW